MPKSQAARHGRFAPVAGGARDGDCEAFGELYRRSEADVHRYLEVALRNRDDSQEVAQLVFLKLFEALPRYGGGCEGFEAWLFTIGRNCAISHRRKHAASTQRRPIHRGPTRAGLRPHRAAGPCMGLVPHPRAAMALLGQAQREVLVLHYLAGLSCPEIATVLGRSKASVRQLECRALVELRAQLVGRGSPAEPQAAAGSSWRPRTS